MADRKPLVLVSGKQWQIPNGDTLLIGAGVEAASGVELALSGGVGATGIVCGGVLKANSGIERSAAGALNIATTDSLVTSVNIGTGSDVATVTIGTGPGTGAGTTNIILDGDVTINGTEVVVGTTTFEGDTGIGDAITDTLTVTAGIAGNLTFRKEGNHVIVVETSAAGAGGGITVQGGTGAAASAGGSASLVGGSGTSAAGGSAYVYGGTAVTSGAGGNVRIRGGSGSPDGTVYIGDATTAAVVIGAVGVGITASTTLPITDSTYNLGSDAVRWAAIYADTLYGAWTPAGDLVPSVDNTYKLGEDETPKRWSDVASVLVTVSSPAGGEHATHNTVLDWDGLVMTAPTAHTFTVKPAAVPNAAGNALLLEGGNSDVVTGGTATLAGGASTTSGTGGAAYVKGGASATGGDVYVLGGDGTGTDGQVHIGSSQTAAIDIGASAITTSVAGPLSVAEATTLKGTVQLGDATGDTITFVGYVGSSIVPSTDNIYSLGTTALRWNKLHALAYYARNDATDAEYASFGADGIAVTLLTDPNDFTITGNTPTTAGKAGGAVKLTGGTGATTGAGGSIVLTAGTSPSGTNGSIDLLVGAALLLRGSLSGGVSTLTVQASTTLGTTGTGNIDLPNNASARFKIEGVSVGATVTAANLLDLTDGGETSLHTHSGIGATDITSQTAGAQLYVGQAVVWDDSAGTAKVYQADGAGAGERLDCAGFCVLAASGDGQPTTVRVSGSLVVPDVYWPSDTAPVAADVGKRVYLSATTPGDVTLTAPDTAGQLALRVGWLIKGGSGTATVAIGIGEGTVN